MSKVYVANNSGHDFSSAEPYGELIFITEGLIHRFQTNQMYRACVEGMRNSSEDDYILMTGLTQINMIAGSIFAYKHGCLNLLIYDAKENDYVSRSIQLENLINLDNLKDR